MGRAPLYELKELRS